MYNIPAELIKAFDGVISFQTLSWLPEYSHPIKIFTELAKRWVSMTSLFFEGNLNCITKVEDHNSLNKPKEYFYNIYSLPLIKKSFAENGFDSFHFKKFEIDIDLDKSNPDGIGTFTEKLADGKRIQFSGPLHLPWYFVYSETQKI
ncbi:MAG: hypothetical protein HQM08_21605 [Candidatus Riflebacteria bacterium]|nr:hypothetical protein [Candidatus Riflebacteria bacterium]